MTKIQNIKDPKERLLKLLEMYRIDLDFIKDMIEDIHEKLVIEGAKI